MAEPCIEWTGSHDQHGYGWNKGRKAHRVAYEEAYGPTTLPVLHSCDNPPCIEPTHLWAGTLRENTLDMMRKGRARFSGRCFTPLQVQDIISRVQAGEVQRAIARELRVHPTTINRIVRGHTWKGVVSP